MEKNDSFSIGQRIYIPFKRFFDIFFSFIFLAALSPFLLIVSIIVWIDTKGFPIFRQKRIGKNDKEFMILKFRSLKKIAPNSVPSHYFDDHQQYMTSFGRFIRKTSIDELPQLINILIGQMSMIGPRPILWNEKDFIEKRKRYKIHKIQPGLTGWAQINGRNLISTEEKIAYDLEYLRHFSIWLDIKIFFITIKYVFTQKNV